MSKSEKNEVKVESTDGEIIIPDIINKYHYNFFSRKDYKVPICLRAINIFLLSLALGSIYLTLKLIGINISYLGFTIFIIIGFLWLLNSLYIQYIVNAKIIIKFYMLLERNDLMNFINELNEFNENRRIEIKDFTVRDIRQAIKIKSTFVSILTVGNKVYVEKIIDTWVLSIVKKEEQLQFAGKISNWKSLQDQYNLGNSFNINNFVFNPDSKSRITGLMAVLFTVTAAIIIKNGDVNIFYEVFSYEGLKLFAVTAILVIELLSIAYMIIGLIKEIIDYIDDCFNDFFVIDKNPSNLRISRFIRRLLLKATIETKK
ncbi:MULTISPECIES: hypothetical protein [unclassified Psychrobacter]|jgi:hypothetical protein|uniref:hypothetical protein n=1 Tax=unclassified Psychrobacter TaxID=196806 RepID=UPI001919B4E8|nr:hypothetical protein [Psychrobacter sp. NC44]